MTNRDRTIGARRAGAAWALLVATAVGACSGDEPGALPRDEEPVAVQVSEGVILHAGGVHPATVVADRQAGVATRISGRIEEMPVDVGSRVRAGQTVVELDGSDVRARIEVAESGARLARKTYRRVEALAADGAASDHELDRARSRLEAAEAELRAARAQAEYTTLTAPFDGVVTARTADPGDLAAPGRPVLTLVSESRRKVRADLPGRLASRVGEGDPAWVLSPEDGREIPVRISRVSPALTRSARRFRVEAELPGDAGLRPGAFVRLALDAGGEESRWIPADAVVRRGQLTGVYTVEDDRLRLRWVRLGLERPGAVELLAGPAEAVVRRPAPKLHDGRSVRRVEREAWAGPGAPGAEADR